MNLPKHASRADRTDERIGAALHADVDRLPLRVTAEFVEERLRRSSRLRMLVAIPAVVGAGVAVVMLLTTLWTPGWDSAGVGTSAGVLSPSQAVVTSSPRPTGARISIDAEGPGDAAAAASAYLSRVAGSLCHGGADIDYVLDPELLLEADSTTSSGVWLAQGWAWLGSAESLIDRLSADTIPGATAPGDMWLLLEPDHGPVAQHIAERRSPGGRSIWLLLDRLVPLDSAFCS